MSINLTQTITLAHYGRYSFADFQTGIAALRCVSRSADGVFYSLEDRIWRKNLREPREEAIGKVSAMGADELAEALAEANEVEKTNEAGVKKQNWNPHFSFDTLVVSRDGFFGYRTGSRVWFGWKKAGEGWEFFVGHEEGFRSGSQLGLSLKGQGWGLVSPKWMSWKVFGISSTRTLVKEERKREKERKGMLKKSFLADQREKEQFGSIPENYDIARYLDPNWKEE